MGLQFVPCIIALLDAGVEVVVDTVELTPHLIGTCTEQCVNLASQALAGFTLLLGAGNVLLREFHPRVGDGDAVQAGKVKNIYNIINCIFSKNYAFISYMYESNTLFFPLCTYSSTI